PTTVTVASKDEKCAAYVQNIFINKFFRVYTSNDVIGMELGGALKNIIALGAGISDGLGFGDNAKAALITRGLAEITRLGDRKSTRLNSSHVSISYAVFCLIKKNVIV